MSEPLQEFVDSGDQRLRVDRAAGIIRGVKLLGLASRNGRRYRENALTDAVRLYEGAKVNINHPKGHPLSPRDYQDRLGLVREVHYRAGDGLFADLHFNPKHALSEQLIWDAEHAPQNVGMSHNVLARTSVDSRDTVVEAITKVQSIDLVADPATTSGLYEHAEKSGVEEQRSSAEEEKRSSGVVEGTASAATLLPYYSATPLASMTLQQLRTHRPDLVAELQQDHEAQLEQLRGELAAITARDLSARRRERILQLLQEHDLPLPTSDGSVDSHLVDDPFIDTLMRAGDDQSVRQLIAERARLVRSAWAWTTERRTPQQRPQSRDQLAGESSSRVRNAKEFASAICSR
jgi:hypothetical protein